MLEAVGLGGNSLPIINYHVRGQTRKALTDYHERFEQAQSEC